jgi:hypothetical protein
MRKAGINIAFLTYQQCWSFWLQKASNILKNKCGVEIVSHCFLSNSVRTESSIVHKVCSAPLRVLDSRSYNPSGIDALSHVERDSSKSIELANETAIVLWLEHQQPDLIICEGNIPKKTINSIRQHSDSRIWMINETWSDGLPSSAYREYLAKSGFVPLLLADITYDKKQYILQKTTSQVSEFSLNQTIHRHFLKVPNMIVRALDMENGKHPASVDHISNLSALETLKIATIQFCRRINQRLTKRNDQAWSIALGTKSPTGTEIPDISSMARLSPPSDRFWADPFLVRENGIDYLFFEELKFGENIGKLAVAEIGPEGFRSNPEIVLEEPWHLSYPQVFKHEGRWYMIPESGDAKRVDLYTTDEFPKNWKRVKTLIKGQRIFDATLLHHDGLWWLFGNAAENGVSDYDELNLYYSTDLMNGDWTPHKANPVISDVRSARPAGPFFKSAGRLFRPSQDSRTRYGYGLVLNEVVELTTDSFKENVVERVLPETEHTDIRGIHTYCNSGELVAIDYIN